MSIMPAREVPDGDPHGGDPLEGTSNSTVNDVVAAYEYGYMGNNLDEGQLKAVLESHNRGYDAFIYGNNSFPDVDSHFMEGNVEPDFTLTNDTGSAYYPLLSGEDDLQEMAACASEIAMTAAPTGLRQRYPDNALGHADGVASQLTMMGGPAIPLPPYPNDARADAADGLPAGLPASVPVHDRGIRGGAEGQGPPPSPGQGGHGPVSSKVFDIQMVDPALVNVSRPVKYPVSRRNARTGVSKSPAKIVDHGNEEAQGRARRGRKRKADDTPSTDAASPLGSKKPRATSAAVIPVSASPAANSPGTNTNTPAGGASAQSQYVRHNPSVVDEPDPYTCPICFHICRAQSTLKTHILEKHPHITKTTIKQYPLMNNPQKLSYFSAQGIDTSYRGSDGKQINSRRRFDLGMKTTDPRYLDDVYKHAPAARQKANSLKKKGGK